MVKATYFIHDPAVSADSGEYMFPPDGGHYWPSTKTYVAGSVSNPTAQDKRRAKLIRRIEKHIARNMKVIEAGWEDAETTGYDELDYRHSMKELRLLTDVLEVLKA